MAPFEAKFSDEEREAVARAYEKHSRGEVVRLAAAGELPGEGGKPLAAFVISPNTVANIAGRMRRQRMGEAPTTLATMPPRDAVEQLRQRLVSAADRELAMVEKLQRSRDLDPADDAAGQRRAERLRQIARAAREAASLPGPNDPRPPAPGQKQNGQRVGGETRGGMAGAILAAHRRSSNGAPAQAIPQETSPTGEQQLEPSTSEEEPADVVRRAMIAQGYTPDDLAHENDVENRPGTTL